MAAPPVLRLPTPERTETTRDELVLKAHNAWLADPGEAAALFREHARLHQERLADYEEKRKWMEREWGEDVHRADSSRFGSYAAPRHDPRARVHRVVPMGRRQPGERRLRLERRRPSRGIGGIVVACG